MIHDCNVGHVGRVPFDSQLLFTWQVVCERRQRRPIRDLEHQTILIRGLARPGWKSAAPEGAGIECE